MYVKTFTMVSVYETKNTSVEADYFSCFFIYRTIKSGAKIKRRDSKGKVSILPPTDLLLRFPDALVPVNRTTHKRVKIRLILESAFNKIGH